MFKEWQLPRTCCQGVQRCSADAPMPLGRFTSDQKETFAGVAGLTITTYSMVSHSGTRSEQSAKVGHTQRHALPCTT